MLKPDFVDIGELNLVKDIYSNFIEYGNGNNKVLFFDCGAKNSQITALLKRNISIDRVTYNFRMDIDELKRKYSGIFISNGPGNPEVLSELIEFIREIVNRKINLPIFGICLGHQILGLASGFGVEKLKYGNRGQNIPAGFYK